MASRKSHRQHSDRAADPGSDDRGSPAVRDPKTIRRRATVYDAVAGRVTTRLIKTNRPSRHRPISSPSSSSSPPAPSSHSTHNIPTRQAPLAPEEVLFRRKDAPPRYAEKDVYFAAADSLAQSDGRTAPLLPASDLLKAAHAYVAGFYEALAAGQEKGGKKRRTVGRRLVDERSMDETALLALGVLLEEAAREALGRDGDLVFTEGGERVDGGGGRGGGGGGEGELEGVGGDSDVGGGRDGQFGRRAKRRRRGRSRRSVTADG